jgi:CDP-paratose 2-epimerase
MSIDQCVHSVFGASKVAADVMVQEYGRNFGLNTACFRGGCLTGPAHSGTELHGFLSYLMWAVLTGRPYTVFGHRAKRTHRARYRAQRRLGSGGGEGWRAHYRLGL